MKKTIIKLISRFVGSKCVTFDGNRVYYWGVPMIAIPMETLVFGQKLLFDSFGEASNEIFYEVGKIQGRNGCNILIKKFRFHPDMNDVSFFTEQTEFVGIGKTAFRKNCKVHEFDSEVSSTFSSAYTKLFEKKSQIAVCNYTRGLIAGAWQAVSKGASGEDISLEGIETTCIAKGDKKCFFTVRPCKNKPHDSITKALKLAQEKETLNVLLRKHPSLAVNSPTQLGKILKQHKLNRPFNFTKEGTVSLLGLPSLITPIDIFSTIYYIERESFGEKVDECFYKTGEFLGKQFTDILIEKFKFKRKNEMLPIILEQIGFFGLGKTEVIKSSKKEQFNIKIYGSPGMYHKQIFGMSQHPVDFFLAGIIGGILESITSKKYEVEEISCVAIRGNYCVFKAICKQ